MNKFYKLILFLVFTMFFQSALFAVEKDSRTGFWFFKSKVIKNTIAINANDTSAFSDIPFKIFLNDTVFINGEPVYQSCVNSESILTFKNTATNSSENSNYLINWGDGSEDFSAPSWVSTTHIYKPGFWTLTYSFTESSGSIFSKTYRIYVRSKPAFNIGTDGLTDNCTGFPIFIPISGTEGNTADTKYTISFNDGSTPILYDPADGVGGIVHTFLKSSCGTKSSTYENAFSATVKAENACGVNEFTLSPIYISTAPKVGLSISKSLNASNPTVYPVNVPIVLKNATTGFVNENGNCNVAPKLVWKIVPSTGFKLLPGEVLGEDYDFDNSKFWVEGSNKITPTFTVSGTYTIKLRVDTKRCGESWKDTTICVEAPLNSQFISNTNEGCSPLTVRTINVTDLSKTCAKTIKWDVSYVAANCGAIPMVWSYINGSSQTSDSPTFVFTTPGIYTLKLTTTNTAGSSTYEQIITVKQPPTVAINTISNFCGTASVQPVAVVDACAPTSNGLDYKWIFDGGTPSTSSSLDPGTISYSTPGSYLAKLTVTNECGSTIAFSNTFVVNPVPMVEIVTSQLKCNGDLLDEIIFSGINGDIYEWTNDNTSIGLAAAGSGPIASFILKNNANEVVKANLTVTLKNSISGCVGTPKLFSITINPSAELTLPYNQVLNNGSFISPVLFSSNNTGGITSYTWINDTPAIGLAESGVGNITSFKALNATNAPSVATITVTPTFTSGGISCSGAPQKFTITVNPVAQMDKPDNIEFCNGAYTPAYIFGTKNTIGTTTYNWTNDNTTIGLKATGTGGIPSFKLINTTEFHQTANITVLPTYTYEGVSNVGEPLQFTINVDPGPDFTQQPVSSFLCRGGIANPLVVTYSGGIGAPTYQWFSNSSNSYDGGTMVELATSKELIPPTSTKGTTYYYCTILLQDGKCDSITSQIATVTINDAARINTNPLASQNLCIGGVIETALTVEYDGGSGVPAYQWYLNASNSNIGGSEIPGASTSSYMPPVFTAVGHYFYYVKVTLSGDNCGSVVSSVAEINVVSNPTIKSEPIATQVVCQNTASTNLEVIAVGGVESIRYQYQWYSNGSNHNFDGAIISGATDSIYTPTAQNIGTSYYYCLIFQDSLTCTVSSSTSAVMVNPNPEITLQPRDTIACKYETILPLQVKYSGGVGVATYQWYSNTEHSAEAAQKIVDATLNTFQPSTSFVGTVYYYCVISGFTGGCTSLTSEIVSVTVNPKANINSQTITICSGSSFSFVSDDASDILPVGTTFTWLAPTSMPANSITGSLAQSIPISEIAQQLTNTTDHLATATYIITPTSGACIGPNFTVTVIVIPTIKPNAIVTNISCFGDGNGSITTDIKGGLPFSSGDLFGTVWTGPNGFTTTTKNVSGLLPGDYLLTVTDAGGCPVVTNYTITEPLELKIVTDAEVDIKCSGSASGQILITINGGTPSYSYNWTKDGLDFSTNEDISNLSPGQYMVAVKDANGCQAQATFDITETKAIKVSTSSIKPNLCFGDAMAEVSVDVDGGSPIELTEGVFGYHFEWAGPNGFTSSNQNLSNLVAGVYQLTVKDALDCSKNFEVTITDPAELILTIETLPITCSGSNNATIVAHVSGGTKPYNIQWSNFRSDSIQKNLSPGNYTIYVTDQNGCQKSMTVNISEANFSVQPTIKNISCNGANDGSIHLDVKGGLAPITLVWSDDPKAGNDRNNLMPGTYTVTLMDGAPCNITESYVIIEPLPIQISAKITNAFECENPNSGVIAVIVSGGTQPYKYKWADGNETASLDRIQSGKYNLTVTDANGCTKTANFDVLRQLPMEVYVSTTADFICETKSFKNTNIAHTSGGFSPYQYSWSSGTVSGENNEMMVTNDNNIIALEVTDALGCKANYTFTINNPLDLPTAKIVYQFVDCRKYTYLFDVKDVDFTGDNYTFTWDFGDGKTTTAQSPMHSFSKTGIYKVKLTKSNGVCPSYYELLLVVEPLPHVALDRVPVFCQGEPSVFYVSGADSYIWSDGSQGDSIVLTQKGKYSVIGFSKTGCNDTLFFTASNYALNNFAINTAKDDAESNTPIHVWTKNIPYSSYTWDFGDGTPVERTSDLFHTFTVPTDGYFDVTLKVVNPNGCVEFDTKRIWVTVPTLPAIITPNGDGANDIFMKDWQIKLFNRNGILIYEGKDGWDGTFKNKLVSAGTYFYVLSYPTELGVKLKNGYVTVVR